MTQNLNMFLGLTQTAQNSQTFASCFALAAIRMVSTSGASALLCKSVDSVCEIKRHSVREKTV